MKTKTLWALLIAIAFVGGAARLCFAASKDKVAKSASNDATAPGLGDEVPRTEFGRRQVLADIDEQIKQDDAGIRTWSSINLSWKRTKENFSAAEDVPDFDTSFKLLEQMQGKAKTREIYATIAKIVNPFAQLTSPLSSVAQQSGRSVDTEALTFAEKYRREAENIDKELFSGGFKKWRRFDDFDFIDIVSSKSAELAPISKQEISELKAVFNKTKYLDVRKRVGDFLDGGFTESASTLKSKQDEFARLRARKTAILVELDKPNTEINDLAIRLGLPLFCVTVVLLICFPIFIQTRSRIEGLAAQLQSIFGSGILVEINTVLLLTMTILILGLADKLPGEVLGTLIGGISGYVLNRFRGRQGQTAPEPESRPSEGNGSIGRLSPAIGD